MQNIGQKITTPVLAGVGVFSFALLWAWNGIAHALAQDYSSLTSGFAAELTAALPVALAAVGLFIGVVMAYRVVRRILSA